MRRMNFEELNEFDMTPLERYDAFLNLYPDISEEQKFAVHILSETELPLGFIENIIVFHHLDEYVTDWHSYANEVAWFLSTRDWFYKNKWVIHETLENIYAEADKLLSEDLLKDILFEKSYDNISDTFSFILHYATRNRGKTSKYVSCGYDNWNHVDGFIWVEGE